MKSNRLFNLSFAIALMAMMLVPTRAFAFRGESRKPEKSKKSIMKLDRPGAPGDSKIRGLKSVHQRGLKRSFTGPASQAAISAVDDLLRPAGSEAVVKRTQTDRLGYTHVRLEQRYKGIPVVGGELIVHRDKQDVIYQVNGKYMEDISVSVEPGVEAQTALEVGLQDLQGKSNLRVSKEPTLVIYGSHLAYHYVLSHDGMPPGRWWYYVDAHTGDLIHRYNNIQYGAPTGNGTHQEVSGNRLVGEDGSVVAMTGWKENVGNYYLYNYNDAWGVFDEDAVDWEQRSTSNWGTADRAAVSLGYNFSLIQDWVTNVLGRDSFNDAGAFARANVHTYEDFVNAYWDGTDFHFGDGDGYQANSLAVLDIAAHEYGHAVTQYTSDLVYEYEPGALNESYSDIMGAIVEFYAQPDGRGSYPSGTPGYSDWLMGEDCMLIDDAGRDLQDPQRFGQPSYYLGTNWWTGPGDNGGVHYNSGVQNFAFYLLAEGGTGINDGVSYDITGIGVTAAGEIAMRVNMYYLTGSSQYKDSAEAWISAATDLGYSEEEIQTVKDVWIAVGVYGIYVPDDYATIQEAIDAAEEGDIIVVRDGTYAGPNNKNLDFGGLAITLRSQHGPANCIIDCEGSGRAFYFHNGETSASVVDGFTVVNGNASDGGAILCSSSSPTIIHCIISGGSSVNGGAINCTGSAPAITNCVLTGNSAVNGGAMYLVDSSAPAVTHCTVSGNIASGDGGAIYCSSSSSVITNCILWGDLPNEISGCSGAVTYSDVQGISPGSGNINADPLFTDPGHWDGDTWVTGDYLPLAASPCIDAGADTGVETDVNRYPRPYDMPDIDNNGELPDFDMGAYEAKYMFVDIANDTNGTPCDEGNGSAGDPYDCIQQALDAAPDGAIISVGEGTYTGAGNKNLNFGGKRITLRSENGPASCIIDCQNSGRGFLFQNGETPASVVDGFTITNGYVANDYGGGICVYSSSPTITNCVISNNETAYDGGGIECFNFSSPIISNCTITGNTGGFGGGIDIWADCAPIISNSTIAGNTGDFGGGIDCFAYCSPIITDCIIRDNISGGPGGGIECYGESYPVITNCTITGNSADTGGGVACEASSSPFLTNCTISGNSASGGGGGIYSDTTSLPNIKNSILFFDWPNEISGTTTVTYSDVQGGFTGNNNINTDPLFFGGGDYHLTGPSPCIDAGTATGAPDHDIDGEARPHGNGYDMGADEYTGLCNYSILPESEDFGEEGGTGSIDVTAPDGCDWSAMSNNIWITITSGAGGSGNGTIEYSVEPNFSIVPRTGSISAPWHTFVIDQAGATCGYTIFPESSTFENGSGGTGTVSVTAPAGCDWSATSNDSWITITPPGAGSGNGTLYYSVTPNPTGVLRTGTLTVAGRTFTVNQEGTPCSYSILPVDESFDGAGGTGSVSITALVGCEWSAASNDGWITITSANTGVGNGAIEYYIPPNPSTDPRTGTMTVASQTFTVDQEGNICDVSLSPESESFDGNGGTGSIDVLMPTGCDWAAASNDGWITLTSGGTGNGNGTIGYSVSSNADTAPRLGTITVESVIFIISQTGVDGLTYSVSSDPSDDFATIQAALDSVADGDVVVVRDGTYTGAGNKNLSFDGKNIMLRSENGADSTTIDCQNNGRGVSFHSGETSNARLEGFTVANGLLSSAFPGGAGVYCSGSSPTIANCVFVNNRAYNGGAIHCSSSSPEIINCTFIDSSASNLGGCFYCINSLPSIYGCTVSGSSANFGGGLYAQTSTPTLINCIISGGSATFGAGLCTSLNSTPILTNCTISENTASSMGGAIYCSSATITNCILWGDSPDEIVGTPIVTYSDVAGTYPGEGNINDPPAFAAAGDYHLIEISPCIDQGTDAGVYTDIDGELRPQGLGFDMGADEYGFPANHCPLLTDAGVTPGSGDTRTTFTFTVHYYDGDGDYPVAAEVVIDGDPRTMELLDGSPVNGTYSHDTRLPAGADYYFFFDDGAGCAQRLPSEGAYDGPEVTGVTRYVPDDYVTIQEAIDDSLGGDTIIVRDNTYTNDGDKNLDFKGKAITLVSENGPENCVIDCQDDGRGFVFHSGETSDAIVNGFAIMNARSLSYGGGIYCAGGSSPTIIDCTISSSMAEFGGGISCNESSSPTITDCTIARNLAGEGGGIYCVSGSSPVITNCEISENSATGKGGGILYNNSSPTITDCTITRNSAGEGGGICSTSGSSSTISGSIILGNSAEDNGGGISCADSSSMSLANCLLSANATVTIYGGGAIYSSTSTMDLTNCTLSGNSSTLQYGGGIYSSGSTMTMLNSILWNDYVPDGPEILLTEFEGIPSHLDVGYSDIKGGEAVVLVDGESTLDWGPGNIDPTGKDPLFMNPPDFYDWTTAPGRTNTAYVADGTRYSMGDVVEIGNDGLARTLTGIAPDMITFAPVLPESSQPHLSIKNFGIGGSVPADFHLYTCSPGIDSGDPASDFSNEPDPNGGRVNLGAYGNTAEAVTSELSTDDDGDTYSECGGDCDDTNPYVHDNCQIVIISGTVRSGVEGGCWVFLAPDGTPYLLVGEGSGLHVECASATITGIILTDWISICMEGIPLYVEDYYFVPSNDSDCDGIPNQFDNCPNDYNPDQANSDSDSYGNACDAFPGDPAEWIDTDGDGIGDNTDTDDDGDGMPDEWELLYPTCLDPLVDDADGNCDGDAFTNYMEYLGDSDPTDENSVPDALSKTFNLEIGLNAITLPFEGTGYTTAGELGEAITDCIAVATWDAISQSYLTYDVGSGGDGFDLAVGDAYFVTVDAASSFVIVGMPPSGLHFSLITTLTTDLSAISMPYDVAGITTAEELGQAIAGCQVVARWDAATQSYQSHVVGFPMLNNFPVSFGEAYFVAVSGDVVWP